MKSLAGTSFFNVVDRLAAAGNRGLKKHEWTHAEATWHRERHSFSGRTYGFAVEVTTVRHERSPKWTLFVVKEYWWPEDSSKAIRTAQWAKAVAGQQRDILSWTRRQQQMIET